MRLVTIFAALGAMSLAACATLPGLGGAGAERRAACDEPPITIYFAPGDESVPQSALPLLRHAKDAADACVAAGGRLNRVVVHAFPDREQTGAEADAAALARAESLVAALVEAGLSPQKVVAIDYRQAGEDDPAHIMRRHADIRLEME